MAKSKDTNSTQNDDADHSVPGLPLPEATQTEENPGVSPSDVNKDASGAGPSGNTSESTPDVNPNE
ncbi:MAG: hypothetical protein ACJ74Y_14445 [Bryobacteraceae bacterium]|jgi:hypothetical protein